MAERREVYLKKIIKHLYFSGELPSSDLSDKIRKSLPVTSVLLNHLIEGGLVVENGFAPSSGGRRPLIFSLSPGLGYILAISMDQMITKMAVLDMHNRYVSEVHQISLNLQENNNSLPELMDEINRFIDATGISKSRILGIGIGMPGFIEVKKGLNHTFLHNEGKSISDYIAQNAGLPVFIDNDSSLIALAELRFGTARGKKNAMIININWGIGLGLILNGELFRGHNGFAGEFSHLPLFVNGKLCNCGKRGCLETEASMLVVIEKARKGLSKGRMSKLRFNSYDSLVEESSAILKAAREGDQFSIELLSETGYLIGRGVAILIHLINPETIILSGKGAAAGKIWQAPIQQALNEHCIPRLSMNTGIEVSQMGEEAGLFGAAALVMENFEKLKSFRIQNPLAEKL